MNENRYTRIYSVRYKTTNIKVRATTAVLFYQPKERVVYVVYLISCKVCGLQYVGSTTTEFRLRFNNHKSRLKAHARMSAADRDSDDCVYRHFYGPGHHGLVDVSVKLIDKVNDKDRLIEKEGQWAYRLRSLKPEGLNDSDFFFSQNRRGRRH